MFPTAEAECKDSSVTLSIPLAYLKKECVNQKGDLMWRAEKKWDWRGALWQKDSLRSREERALIQQRERLARLADASPMERWAIWPSARMPAHSGASDPLFTLESEISTQPPDLIMDRLPMVLPFSCGDKVYCFLVPLGYLFHLQLSSSK